MDPDTEAKIMNLKAKGHTLREIGKLVGYSESMVCRILKKHSKNQPIAIFTPPERHGRCVFCNSSIPLWEYRDYIFCREPACCQAFIEARLDASYSPSDKAHFGRDAMGNPFSVVHREPNGTLKLFRDAHSHLRYHFGVGSPMATKNPKRK